LTNGFSLGVGCLLHYPDDVTEKKKKRKSDCGITYFAPRINILLTELKGVLGQYDRNIIFFFLVQAMHDVTTGSWDFIVQLLMRTLMRPALDAKCKNNISAQFFCYIA
jgi:hypothetical protein